MRKVKRICPNCGKEFQTIAGKITRKYCDKCAEAKWEQEKKRDLETRLTAAEAQYQKLKDLAKIPPMWCDITFESSNQKRNEEAFQFALEYARTFNTKTSGSITFWSEQHNTGKTHLSVCIINYVLHELKRPVLFQKAHDRWGTIAVELRHIVLR